MAPEGSWFHRSTGTQTLIEATTRRTQHFARYSLLATRRRRLLKYASPRGFKYADVTTTPVAVNDY